MKFIVFIPSLPPVGINDAYGVGRASITNEGQLKSGRIYKKKDALEWDEKAIQIIRNRAILDNWKKISEYLSLEFYWWGRPNNDVDSFEKTLMDAVAYALGFNDKHILKYHIEKLLQQPTGMKDTYSEGFIAIVKNYKVKERNIGEFYKY